MRRLLNRSMAFGRMLPRFLLPCGRRWPEGTDEGGNASDRPHPRPLIPLPRTSPLGEKKQVAPARFTKEVLTW